MSTSPTIPASSAAATTTAATPTSAASGQNLNVDRWRQILFKIEMVETQLILMILLLGRRSMLGSSSSQVQRRERQLCLSSPKRERYKFKPNWNNNNCDSQIPTQYLHYRKFITPRWCLTSPPCSGTPLAPWLLSSKRSSTSIQPSILRFLSPTQHRHPFIYQPTSVSPSPVEPTQPIAGAHCPPEQQSL